MEFYPDDVIQAVAKKPATEGINISLDSLFIGHDFLKHDWQCDEGKMASAITITGYWNMGSSKTA